MARRDWDSLGQGEANPLVLREPQVAEARAALAAAEAALAQAERDIERCTVRAPYAGRVRSKAVDVGQFVARGAELARLYAIDYAEVRLPLADDELAFVDLPLAFRGDTATGDGPEVLLSARFAGREHVWEGRLVRTEGEIDPDTRMVVAVARVEDPYGRGGDERRPPLAVGLFTRAEIQGRVVEDVVVLPRRALRDGRSVLVVDGDDRLRIRPVEVLRSEGERVLLSAGVASGERVVATPLEIAVDGMRVRPEAADPEPGPEPEEAR